MTRAPEVLYKITWKFDGLPERTALATYAAANEIRIAFLNHSHGVTVSLVPAEATTGRHSAPPVPVDEPLTGAAADRVRDRLRALRVERCKCSAKAAGYADTGMHSIGCPADDIVMPVRRSSGTDYGQALRDAGELNGGWH
jgi:hypothetical protein